MSQNACEVLYVKYNSARRPEFRVTTEICEGLDGRFVRKRAGAPAAETHLENIHQNALGLRDYYSGISIIESQRCDGALRFPYVTGQTLAEQIDARHFDRAKFVEQVGAKLDAVLDVQPQYRMSFESTEEFEAVFGKTELGGVPALNPANIDSLLTNFIENDGGICCIDCEWVCRFPVPVDYIRYRILRYFYLNQVQSLLEGASLEDMLGWFGISGETLESFWQMERRFQQYIHGEDWKYIYTDRYRKKNVSIEYFDREIQVRETEIAVKDGAIRDKDVHIENLKAENDAKDVHIGNLEAEIAGKDGAIQDKEVHIKNIEAMLSDRDRRIQELTQSYMEISNSFFWRVTKPARVTLDAVKRVARSHESLYLFLRMGKDTLRHGPGYAMKRRQTYLAAKSKIRAANSWPSEEERARQSQKAFPLDITFSILVPLYNTPEEFLRQMIQSVQDQTYAKWELCLADGSDAEHGAVGKYCKEAAREDARIKYRKLEKNLGISGNTNACIDMATGDYIALFDHDDILHPSALYEDMIVICNEGADFIYTDENTFHDTPSDAFNPHFKPDFAPDTLRANNYICHFTVFKRDLLEKAGGGFRPEFDGSQDFDMVLRLTEQAQKIVHIPKILYFWRAHKDSVAKDVSAKPYVIDAAKRAIGEHLKRVGLEGEVLESVVPSMYRLKYAIHGTPLISILIPNKDHIDDLRRCVDSIRNVSTYPNWEIVIIENNSESRETFDYYDALTEDPRIRVVYWEGPFNYSAINNFGFRAAKGDHILLLNNDTEVISPDWLQEMLMYSQRSDVGAVGAKLYYPDHTIQHAGLGIGILTLAGHYHRHFDGNHPGYMGRLIYAQDVSGVTAACMMLPRHVYEEMNGLDETFEVAFNDVDLCMRIRKAGYLIVFTPFAELYHYESKTRGLDSAPEKRQRFVGEVTRFQTRWAEELAKGDPYYNPNFSLDSEDFSIL